MKKIILLFTVIFITFASGCTSKQQNKAEPNPEVKQEVEPTQKIETEKGPNDKNPLVTIEMEDGSIIKVELYPEIAPNTVRNFVSLTNSKYYDGVIFHRVIPGFMIQGGDPDGTGMGGPGYEIAGEFSNNGFDNVLKHERGVISMARSSEPNSGGSQFFIMVDSAAQLDTDYAAFGKVTEGMETADKIVSVETGQNDRPKKDQIMKKVTVDTFGVKYGEVEKMK
ncbi:MAG: peptidylprolyl isomerase [Clostridiaceae bacterium]|nr:peptidylprolyl isomerase [Clostridiaceae bacterium]